MARCGERLGIWRGEQLQMQRAFQIEQASLTLCLKLEDGVIFVLIQQRYRQRLAIYATI